MKLGFLSSQTQPVFFVGILALLSSLYFCYWEGEEVEVALEIANISSHLHQNLVITWLHLVIRKLKNSFGVGDQMPS